MKARCAGHATGGWERARPAPQRMRLALPTQLCAGAVYIRREDGAFAARGIELAIGPHVTGKAALDAVLRDEADLAIVADTPFALAVLRGSPVAAISAIYSSRKTMALMAARATVRVPADLAGKTIGTAFGTNAQYFLDTMMLAHGVPRSSVTIVDVPPAQLQQALLSGRVDAVTIWHPQRALLRDALGAEATTPLGEDIFVYRFLLVAKTDYIERNTAAIGRLLDGLEQAIESIQRDPARARQVIARGIGLAPALLQDGFDASDFYLSLDQSLLLERDVRTQMAQIEMAEFTVRAVTHCRYLIMEAAMFGQARSSSQWQLRIASFRQGLREHRDGKPGDEALLARSYHRPLKQ